MTARPGATNVAHLLAATADRTPDALALVDEPQSLSYAALAARAGAFADAIRGQGAKPGDRIAILLPRSADAAAALFGIYAAGGVAVVLNDRLRPRQIEHVLSDSGARALISSTDETSRLPRTIESTAALIDVAAVPTAAAFTVYAATATDVAQIIYTSGSTGLPKGVVYPHATVLTGVRLVTSYLAHRPADRVVSLLAFSAVYGLNQLLCNTSTGSTLIIERSPLAAEVVASLRRHNITVAAAVPPLWLQLLAVPDFLSPLPGLRQCQNAGGHLPVEAVRKLRAAQPQAELILQYGMTETYRGTYLPSRHTDERPGSMGLPIGETEILVVREDRTLCDVGEVGELVHAGPTVAAGYWNAATAKTGVFGEHPLRPGERAVYSGDMVKRDAEGFLYYVSRRDTMIKTQGFRVGPDEIVDVLHASGMIAEAAVVAEDDAARGQKIVAHVVLKPGSDVKLLTRYCRNELPPYMLPARFEVHEHLPRLAGGKYDLGALAQKSPA